MYQKASPEGEPRTWFSHPKNSKNEVLPAWELSFRVLLFFVVFYVFGRPFENSSFTCMGAQFCEYPPPKDNKKKHKKTPELYQKASPKGEPRTWFSHPKNSKNEVLPAWELSFRVLLFFVVFYVFGRPFENSSFTCMGAQFWRTRSAILCFLSFLKTQKNTSGGFSGPLGSKTPPHGPKTPPNHDFGTILEVFRPILQGFLV